MSRLHEEEFHNRAALYPFLERMFGWALQYRQSFWRFTIAVAIVALVDAAFPFVWKALIDDVLVKHVPAIHQSLEQGVDINAGLSEAFPYVAAFLLLAFLQVAAIYFFIRFAGYLETSIMHDMRQEMFEKLQRLTFSFYDRSAVGWLLSRVTSDAERVTQVVSWGLVEGIWGLTMIVVTLSVMLILNWQLALIVIVSIPVLMLISVKLRMLILRYSRQTRKLNSEITARYNEHINGVEVNKSTAQERRASADFRQLSGSMRHSSYRAQYYTALYLPLVIVIGSIVAALVIYVGGQMGIAMPAAIEIGVLALFFTYATRIFEPIYDITHFYALAQGSISAGERIFSLLDTEVEIEDKADAGSFGKIEGKVEFRNVSFYYEKDKPVLRNVSLQVEPGESIALVGATGGGKTTIVNLLCRFYDVKEGAVLIDGQDIRDNTMGSLRQQMGVVLQTPHLFSGTMRENLRYGRDDAGDEQIKAALRLVGAEEFIERLDEEVGENGDNLSLGERQLISFARAVLIDPRIFIMDEATSSVDVVTELRIQRSIEEMIAGRTSFIIAHRLSTIRNCDRILYVQNGRITEEGSHTELMERRGDYYRLYTSQLRGAGAKV